MKKSILPVFPVIVLFMLLLYPALSFEGAKNGLLLWFNIVLPTLLPFMLCSGIIVAWNGAGYLTRPLKPLFKLLGLSPAGGYTWLCGLLCGYPMGAKTAADFVKNGKLTPREGKRLLAIAGCPSPMFLAGYIKLNLPSPSFFLPVAAALYMPLILLAWLSARVYQVEVSECGRNCESTGKYVSPADSREELKPFDCILMDSLEIMVKIGGYIMMFSILAVYTGYFLPKGSGLKPLILGGIEMTTGIQSISGSMQGVHAAAAIAASAAFGGLSGVFQTKTVIKNAGLSIRHYVLWKLLHAASTGLLIILLSYR